MRSVSTETNLPKSMDKKDLDFEYPEHLVATEKKPISRVMLVENNDPVEITINSLLNQIEPNDVLVINDTKVIPARVFSDDGLEILFIEKLDNELWKVLCPARKWSKNKTQKLPDGVELEMIERGRPQVVKTSRPIDTEYFLKYGDIPLPPYIQEARGERRSWDKDKQMYQTAWAEQLGSLAAPTASLHFTESDLDKLKARGTQVHKLCLHVGLGTFLPIHADNLDEHIMHSEQVVIPKETWLAVNECRQSGGKVWALGSTVTRALEAQANGHLKETSGGFVGDTDLFIQPGYEFKIVDRLMTNFHQPESTLIAMVMAFAGLEKVKDCYQWAIERNFRLFSYGDLSVWKK